MLGELKVMITSGSRERRKDYHSAHSFHKRREEASAPPLSVISCQKHLVNVKSAQIRRFRRP